MHRTPNTILATSQNKVKHFFPPHYFTQAREYNTQTNPLPLFHTGKEDPFPLLHTDERVFIRSLSAKNLIQHLIPPKLFKQGKTLPTCNTWELHITNKIHNTTSCLGNKVP